MGASLAGTIRLKIENVLIGPPILPGMQCIVEVPELRVSVSVPLVFWILGKQNSCLLPIVRSCAKTNRWKQYGRICNKLGFQSHQILYSSLLMDNAVTMGYLQEFLSLEKPARRAAKRLQISAASISDSMAATALFVLRREADRRATEVISISDQLLIAADIRPKKFRTKWQRAVYDGPTARKDAELAERDRWIQLLANLLRSTDTPMGKLIRESPSNIQLLGGGRQAGTLRSRVRSVQKFLGWLIASHGISFPVHWRQLTEYLQVRYSEPCVRGALKLVHSSYIFLQEVSGIEDKLTDSAIVRGVVEGTLVSSKPWKTATSGAQVPNDIAGSF